MVLLFAFITSNNAQMNINGQTFYGNEWIDYNKTYYKIKVAEDGLYKIDYKTLADAGFFSEGNYAQGIAVINYGKQISLYLSNQGNLTESDYILFYGTKNRNQLDTFLYEGRNNELLNPDISLFSDTNIYYIVYDRDVAKAPRIKLVYPDYSSINLPFSKYYWHTENHNFFNTHHKPVLNVDNVRLSYFWKSEGYIKTFASSTLDTFNCKDLYDEENLMASLSLTISTNAHNVNNKDISINDNFLGRDETRINNIARLQYQIEADKVKETNIVKIVGESSEQNHGLANAKLSFPRKYKFENNQEYLAISSDKYFNFGDFEFSNDMIYEVNSASLYKTNKKNNINTVYINDSKEKALDIRSEPIEINQLIKTNFKNYKGSDLNYLIISSKKLYTSEGGNVDVISEYKNYRNSEKGGSYKVDVIFDDEIYDQFGYGIVNHPLSFKNMTQYFQKQWKNWEYVFLIGKGREYNTIRTNEQLTSVINDSYYLPTYGISPSDLLLFTAGNSLFSKLGIGRLANTNMLELSAYLEKIKVREEALRNPKSNAWLKNIMHLGGGTAIGEKQQIKGYLTRMEEVIEKPMYGANVLTFYKENDAQTQIANLPKIEQGINEGLSIINFFGHAAVGTFDFSLDDPSNYQNEGRLPFMFSLGCYSGNICTPIKGVSEKFVLIKDKGAIGFIAASGSAYLNRQGDVGIQFYDLAGNEFYGKQVSKIIKRINDDFDTLINNNYFSISNISQTSLHQQLVLHADPALVISAFEKPDYSIKYNKITTVPSELTIEKDSFDLNFSVENHGKAISDSFDIYIQHILPDQKIATEKTIRILAPYYSESISLKLRLNDFNALGLNKIKIRIDSKSEIEEFNENNNEVINENNGNFFPFYVLSNKVKTQYPCEFAILNKNHKFELRANSVNVLSGKKNYIIQIDTTKYFNSPIFKEQKLFDSFGSIVWTPALNLENNVTYYWRASELGNNNEPLLWAESSFTYLPESPDGWTQRHIYQYEKNKLTNLIPKPKQQFAFSDIEQLINVRSQIYFDENNVPFTLVNGSKYNSMTPFRGNADVLNVLIWTRDGIYRNISKTDYGSLNHSNNVFPFDISNEAGRKGLKELSENIPDSAFVFMYVYIKNQNSTFNVSEWNKDMNSLGYTIYNTLEDAGAKEFIKMKDAGVVPYILIYRKGFGVINETIGENVFQQISATATINSRGFFGMMSANVGPASKWKSFDWSYSNATGQDTFLRNFLHIYKIDISGNEVLHKYRFQDNTFDISDIDASQYPELRLEFECVDYDDFIPGSIQNWNVLYEGFPDIYLTTATTLSDTIDQGQLLNLTINTGVVNADSVENINYLFKLINSASLELKEIKTIPLLKNLKEQGISVSFDTKNLNGNFQLIASANHDMNVREKVTSNNNGVKTVYIKPDRINPLLNVTFDGINILDGDIVGPTPTIEINIKDENKYLILNNNSLAKLELLNLETNERNSIDISDNRLEVNYPTNANDNNLVIKFRPELSDGEYNLLVQSRDASNNASGNLEYNVKFKVISKKAISNFVNYPNPFSSSTQFVFDLTGDIPDQLSIQIMTVSGKVVKEITKEELGALKIGTNRTTYKWNGTDDYGSKLANGVYVYRIITSKEFDNTNLGNSKLGKLVIIR